MTERSEALRGVRVLLIEGDRAGSEIRERLVGFGADVAGDVDSVEAARELAVTLRPDLVLMELRFGGDLARIDAADGILHDLGIPTVFLASRSEWEIVARASRSGPFAFLFAPFDDAQLIATLQVAMHRSRLERELRERRRSEETSPRSGELQAAQRLEVVGRLAGGIAHDFNNALTVINGRSRHVLSALDADDPIRESIEDILGAGELAAKLTTQLLAFSGRQVIRATVFDLNSLVQRVQPAIAHMLGDTIRLETKTNDETIATFADPHQIEQVLLNLCFNARDAMPEGGTLTIEARSERPLGADGTPVLVVRDDGVGMDDETLERVFEPFFTTKEVGQGSGLGLAAVRGIVDQSGGSVEVTSVAGEGTTVTVRLPPALAEHAPVPAAPASEIDGADTGSASGGSGHVLVVEDQEEVRRYVADALSSYGYRTLEVPDAARALEVFDAAEPAIDFVVSDVVMPGKSGFELALELRRLRPGVGVLLMSGYAREATKPDQENIPFIRKPFAPEELVRRVRATIESFARPIRVLVADDEDRVRGFLREALEEAGYEVMEASDGNQAIRAVLSSDVDLVITDLVMPHQGGMGTIQTLRRNVPGIGIIAISGAFEGRDLKTAETLGADVAMAKPLRVNELIATVAEVLRTRRRRVPNP